MNQHRDSPSLSLLLAARVLYGLVLALWLGGLTFYSIVVVPLGAERWGTVEQGFLTASVTQRLNWIAVVVISAATLDALRSRNRLRVATVAFLAASQICLFVLHHRLSTQMDFDAATIVDGSEFYSLHRIYLLVTAAQWLVGLGIFIRLLLRVRNSPKPA